MAAPSWRLILCVTAWRPRTGWCSNNPAYSHYYLNLGEISTYPQGYKENGSVFCHTNPWIMVAETN